jgi:hypothetical protein
MRKKYLCYISLIISLVLISCAYTMLGAPYKGIDNIPENKGLIYFYWTNDARYSEYYGKNFQLHIDNQFACYVTPGGYSPYFTDPGNHHVQLKFALYTPPTHQTDLEIKAGQAYYVKVNTVTSDSGFKWSLVEISPEDAMNEIVHLNIFSPHFR